MRYYDDALFLRSGFAMDRSSSHPVGSLPGDQTDPRSPAALHQVSDTQLLELKAEVDDVDDVDAMKSTRSRCHQTWRAGTSTPLILCCFRSVDLFAMLMQEYIRCQKHLV